MVEPAPRIKKAIKRSKLDLDNIFKNKAELIHVDEFGNPLYDYSKVKYIDQSIKVKIICHKKDQFGKEHGVFEQTPKGHLKARGCIKCRNDSYTKSKENFIQEAEMMFSDVNNIPLYDYSEFEYINSKVKGKIICHKKDKNGIEHGIFWQDPNDHLQGRGCVKCGKESMAKKLTMSFDVFKNKAEKVQGKGKYTYIESTYVNAQTKMEMICEICKFHFWQAPSIHLMNHGCPNHNEYKGEKRLKEVLIKLNCSFIPQYKFNDCRNKLPLSFDIGLPDMNIMFEYDGIGHYKPVKYDSKMTDVQALQRFIEVKQHDQIKNEYCKKNEIKLIRIPYWDYDKIDIIVKQTLGLI